MHTTRPRWEDQRHLLIDLAVADLRGGGDVLPSMAAFAGDQPLFLATLRPFDKGAHQDAILEVGALAVGLGADRLALSLSGRAWSLLDPIPPVLDDGCDLRQRVIVVHTADATTDDPMATSTIVPFDKGAEDRVVLGQAIADQAGEGWAPHALLLMAAGGGPAGGPPVGDADLGRQVLRCEALGHRLAWSRDLLARLDRLRLLALCE